jgi:hypothetical protein
MKIKALDLIWIGLAGIVFLAMKAKENILNKLSVSLDSIKPDIANLRLKIKLNIFNPLPTSVPITAITGKISVSGKDLADFMNTSGFVLTPGSNFIELNAFPQFSNVITSAENLLKGRIDFNYTITAGPLSYTSTFIYNI